jgi:4'-phosphopantetheinyl transferase
MKTGAPDIIHIWQARLQVSAAALARARDLLSTAELSQADRFAFPEGRMRYAAAHAFLRRALAFELIRLGDSPIDPRLLEFSAEPAGKPTLAHYPHLQFSLAHCDDLALCAVCAGRRLGLDLEGPRPVPEALEIARRHFSPSEAAQLEQLPAGDVTPAFLRLWTRKEAYLKATGEGLAQDLAGLPVLPQMVPAVPERWQEISADAGFENDAFMELQPGAKPPFIFEFIPFKSHFACLVVL